MIDDPERCSPNTGDGGRPSPAFAFRKGLKIERAELAADRLAGSLPVQFLEKFILLHRGGVP